MRRGLAARPHLAAHFLWGNDMGKILQFPLSQIPDNGLDVALDLELDDLGEVWFRASSLKLVGKLEKTGSDEVSFQGRLSGRFLLECSLGLAEFLHPFDEPLAIYFSQMPQDFGSEDEVELNEEDLEVAYIENETVDLTTPVHDQIGLAIPIQPRCPDRCLGEAPETCRKLDEGASVGVGAGSDPRWGPLQGWRPEDSS